MRKKSEDTRKEEFINWVLFGCFASLFPVVMNALYNLVFYHEFDVITVSPDFLVATIAVIASVASYAITYKKENKIDGERIIAICIVVNACGVYMYARIVEEFKQTATIKEAEKTNNAKILLLITLVFLLLGIFLAIRMSGLKPRKDEKE